MSWFSKESKSEPTTVDRVEPEPAPAGDDPVRILDEPPRDPVDADVVRRLKEDPELAEVAEAAELLLSRSS